MSQIHFLFTFCLFELSFASLADPLVPLLSTLPQSFPVLGQGSLTVIFSEADLSPALLATLTKVRKPLLKALAEVTEVREAAKLKECYYEEENSNGEQKFVCVCTTENPRVTTALLIFSEVKQGRSLQSCAPFCDQCSQSPSRCLSCATGYMPVHSLPGPCTEKCDSSCESCEKSSLWCTKCARGFMPIVSSPGYCTSKCSESCRTCEPFSSVTCRECASDYLPRVELPGSCTSTCDPSCAVCSKSSITCEECASGYFPEVRLPGICQKTCSISCRKCHISAVMCDECNNGYHPAGDLPGYCITA